MEVKLLQIKVQTFDGLHGSIILQFSAHCFTHPLQTGEPRRDLSPSDARLFSGKLATDPIMKP